LFIFDVAALSWSLHFDVCHETLLKTFSTPGRTTVFALSTDDCSIFLPIFVAVFLSAATPVLPPPGRGMIGAVERALFANPSILFTTPSVNFVLHNVNIRIVHIIPIPKIFKMIHGKKSSIPEIPISCVGTSIHSFVITRLIHVLFHSLDVFIPMLCRLFPFVSHSLSTERKTILILIANVAMTGRNIIESALLIE